MAMPNVWCVLDMDGFPLREKFLCRELGVCWPNDNFRSESFFFNVGNFLSLSAEDRRTVNYVVKRVHGLWFTNKLRKRRALSLPQTALDEIIKALDARRPEGAVFAFKGGHLERDLLVRNGIDAFINLEEFGCPKIDKLSPLYKKFQCGEHVYPTLHCPAYETYCFAKWLMALKLASNE